MIRSVTPACMPTSLPIRLLAAPATGLPQVATGLATRSNAVMDYLSPNWAALYSKPAADLVRAPPRPSAVPVSRSKALASFGMKQLTLPGGGFLLAFALACGGIRALSKFYTYGNDLFSTWFGYAGWTSSFRLMHA